MDTSVVLYDALAINAFSETDIHIPLQVIEEIDRFKRDLGEKGRNARHFSRFMDTLRGRGSLTKGVTLDSGSRLYVNMPIAPDEGFEILAPLNMSRPDSQILSAALWIQKRFPESSVEIITKDINLRLKADVFGIKSRDYDPDRAASAEEMYTGVRRMEIDSQSIERFFHEGFLIPKTEKLYANQYVAMQSPEQSSPAQANEPAESKTALGRYDKRQNKILPLLSFEKPLSKIYPRNTEQSFAFDALLNDSFRFVSLVGKAGTGKTLLALAAGLYKTMEEGKYRRLLVSRPIFPMGRDIGYLPGDIGQKLNPWMQPVFDGLEFIMGMGKKSSRLTQDLMDQGLLNIEPLVYIRGRSIPNQYLIVDEAQNLTPHEIKTIVTRAGLGTKVVLTGDCYQIDNPYVDASNSGLSCCVEKFKGAEIAAHVAFQKGERSDLAEMAANLL